MWKSIEVTDWGETINKPVFKAYRRDAYSVQFVDMHDDGSLETRWVLENNTIPPVNFNLSTTVQFEITYDNCTVSD